MALRNFSKDPSDVLDYVFNFGNTGPNIAPCDPGWLEPGDYITGTPIIDISGPDDSLALATPAVVTSAATQVLVWLVGGTGGTYHVACTIGTIEGRVVKKSFTLNVRPG